MSGALRISQIGQIAIVVRDIDRATAFYRDRLGMAFLFSASGMSFFDCGGVRIMLTRPEQPASDHPASILYFKVADIHQAHQQLLDRGVRFENSPHLIAKLPDHDLWMCFFRDSENNLMGLMCEVRE